MSVSQPCLPRPQYQAASEMSQIDQPLVANMMENRVRRRATAPRMQALWGNGPEDYKLRREEQLGAMRQEVRACVCVCVWSLKEHNFFTF